MKDGSKNTDPLVEAVAGFIDARKLLTPGQRAVVGVSGGCDSLAVLAVLRQLARSEGRDYQLTVAHLDHALRDESGDDAAFVAELAREWDLPCVIERIDVGKIAKEQSLSIEAAARMARYDFLQRSAAQSGGKCVVVAHHADDNAETICHRIFRGSHLRGASGMRAVRAMGESDTLLVRPLLNCRRAEIEAFCKRMDITWRTDPTNAKCDFTRNFIRNELLPLIRERINPDADMALVRLAKAIGEAEEYISAQTRDIARKCIGTNRNGQITIDTSRLNDIPRALRGWIFRRAMQQAKITPGKISSGKLEELSALADNNLQTVNLPDDYVARRSEDMIIIAHAAATELPPEQPVTLSLPGETKLPSGATLRCSFTEFDQQLFEDHCKGHPRGVELLDADKIRGQLICRPRVPGDRLAPLGLDGTQSVSDFLTNASMPTEERNNVRCICDDEGIVYLSPLRIDQRVKVSTATSRLIRIEIIGGPNPAGT
ncbi:MAG: tRNA lysidine(34) synthetase TilS [bacterium]|nr:tRNA lysidine(34) synthetase TilS [bacterium]